jgi:hydrogenase/urease accessory protein HupE
MSPETRRTGLVAALLAAVSPSANAHLVSARFGDFYVGLMHPLTAFENALPWLALALLVGLQTARVSRAALVAFPAAVAVGAASTQLLPALSGIANANAASFVVLGVLVAIAPRIRLALLVALTTLVGLTHGYDNGLAFTRGGNLSLFVGGVASAAYLSLTLVAAGAYRLSALATWGTVALRAAGSWIAAIGIMITGLTLAPA